MIPVVVVPVVSRHDLLEQNLSAFDEPVERLVIIDNALSGYEYSGSGPFERVEVIRPVLPLGVTGGFNAGIAQTPDAPWWLLTSTDIAYGPDDLGTIAELMDAEAGPAVVTGSRDDDRLLRGAYMALNRACVESVGLYDEWAFFPCYFEDDDYVRRCELAGVEWIEYDGEIRHDRSITIRSDEHMALRNQETYPDNHRRYVEKWGGAPGHETFPSPYGLPVPLSYMKVDLAGRAARRW